MVQEKEFFLKHLITLVMRSFHPFELKGCLINTFHNALSLMGGLFTIPIILNKLVMNVLHVFLDIVYCYYQNNIYNNVLDHFLKPRKVENDI